MMDRGGHHMMDRVHYMMDRVHYMMDGVHHMMAGYFMCLCFCIIQFAKAAKKCGIWLEARCLLAICYAFVAAFVYIYIFSICAAFAPLFLGCASLSLHFDILI